MPRTAAQPDRHPIPAELLTWEKLVVPSTREELVASFDWRSAIEVYATNPNDVTALRPIVRIYARCQADRVLIGEGEAIGTEPPVPANPVQRLAAWARGAGADMWDVTLTATFDRALPTLQPIIVTVVAWGREPVDQPSGSRVIRPYWSGENAVPVNTLLNSDVVNVGPTRWLEFTGKSSAIVTTWFMLFDATAVPPDGTFPDAPPVEVPTTSPNFFVSNNPRGRRFRRGCAWAASTTEGALTASVIVGGVYRVMGSFSRVLYET